MSGNEHFRPELFEFLRELRENNNKEWFAANRERYETNVLQPLLGFISDFGPRLHEISPNFVADPRKSGGSMFRIHRDTRFSRDKTPYKTNAGAQFNHVKGKNVHSPGFYIHLEPDNVFAGNGIWHPDSKTLAKIRDRIVAHPNRWREAISGKSFTDMCTLSGDSLNRHPRGYDTDHPLIEDLKRKDFISLTPFAEADACSPDFLDRFTQACRAAAPFVEFLTTAVGLEW